MWEARAEPVTSGVRYQIYRDGGALCFRDLFLHLERDDAFANWYTDLLAAAPLSTFFWEHPPLTDERLRERAEFVLIDAPALVGRVAAPDDFEDLFAKHPDEDVITFPNRGRDALLVVPRPIGSRDAYPHLAAFVRSAPAPQVRGLWCEAARALHEVVGARPRWLSTAGLGTSWLHLRLDTRPKYYRFAPYKTVP